MWDRGLLPSHPLSPKTSGPSGQGWACPHLAIFGAQTASQMLTLSGQGPPLPADGGVSRGHNWSGLSYLQPTALQPWPAVLAITVPSQGSGCHFPGGKVST